jgi:hypothetical protein
MNILKQIYDMIRNDFSKLIKGIKRHGFKQVLQGFKMSSVEAVNPRIPGAIDSQI